MCFFLSSPAVSTEICPGQGLAQALRNCLLSRHGLCPGQPGKHSQADGMDSNQCKAMLRVQAQNPLCIMMVHSSSNGSSNYNLILFGYNWMQDHVTLSSRNCLCVTRHLLLLVIRYTSKQDCLGYVKRESSGAQGRNTKISVMLEHGSWRSPVEAIPLPLTLQLPSSDCRDNAAKRRIAASEPFPAGSKLHENGLVDGWEALRLKGQFQ